MFEEYRGFKVNFSHKRTSPVKKDVFIYSTLSEGLGYAGKMNTSDPGAFVFHSIRENEMGSEREMNHRVCSGYHKMLQRAVRVRAGTSTENKNASGAYGHAYSFGHLYSPNIPANMVQAIIYRTNIRNDLEDQQIAGRPHISESEVVRIVIAYEIAHHMHVNEYYGDTPSAMRRTKYLDEKRGVFPAHLHNHEYELTNY